MKKILIAVLALVVLFSLSACGKKNFEQKPQENLPPVSDNTNNETYVTLTNEEMYGSLIADYEKVIAEYDLENVEVENTVPDNISETLVIHIVRYANEGVTLTHAFYDIDKNGIDELLVGANNGLGAIYTYNKELQKVVAIAFQSTMERGNMSVYDNGIIFIEGAGGAALHYFEFGLMGTDGVTYQLVESIQEEYTIENETPIYTNAVTGEELEYKSLDEIMNKYVGDSTAYLFGKEGA